MGSEVNGRPSSFGSRGGDDAGERGDEGGAEVGVRLVELAAHLCAERHGPVGTHDGINNLMRREGAGWGRSVR